MAFTRSFVLGHVADHAMSIAEGEHNEANQGRTRRGTTARYAAETTGAANHNGHKRWRSARKARHAAIPSTEAMAAPVAASPVGANGFGLSGGCPAYEAAPYINIVAQNRPAHQPNRMRLTIPASVPRAYDPSWSFDDISCSAHVQNTSVVDREEHVQWDRRQSKSEGDLRRRG
jgi:hypothetical protein